VKRRKHTPDQVVRKLREADRLLAEGKDVAEVAKHLEISEQTDQRWRNQYGGLKADDAKRLKELTTENVRLMGADELRADNPIRHDRTREHGALANPGGRPQRINAA
jgi:putative transposase